MPPALHSSRSFMPHVNGIRAIAILGILFYHLNSAYCPAGYFGVDAFLVISGYFLLSSLMKAEKSQDIHYGSFLLKKAWRIIPSWLLVSCVFCLLGAMFMLAADGANSYLTAAASSIFLADYLIDLRYDYFNPNAHDNLFLHYWYLSITVQMYLVIPLLLILSLKFLSKKLTVVLLALLAALSLCFYGVTTSLHLPAYVREGILGAVGMRTAYYHLLPRLWEILAGGAVLLLPDWRDRPGLRLTLESLGAVGLIASFFCFKTGSAQVYPAVLSTILMLRYGGDGWFSRILSLRPVQWIGTISFSLYLWHWPIMVAWKYATLGDITPRDEWGMVVLSFLLAALAWRYVEQLKMPQPSSLVKRCACFMPIAVLPVFCVASGKYYLHTRQQVAQAMPGNDSDVAKYANSRPRDEALLEGFEQGSFERLPSYIGNTQGVAPSFLLMGDSHSRHLYMGLEHYCNYHHQRGVFLNNSVSPYWWCYKFSSSGSASWDERKAEALLAYLKAQPCVKYVFIAQSWHMQLYGTSTELLADTTDWRTMEKLNQGEQDRLREEGLRETCRRLSEMGARVVLLADTPRLPSEPVPYPHWFRMKKIYNHTPEPCKISLQQHGQREARYNDLFRNLKEEGVVWGIIDCAEPLRDGEHYRIQQGDDFFFYDNNHLSLSGSILVADYVMKEWERMKQADAATAVPSTPQ